MVMLQPREGYHQQIEALCRRYHVARLELFGSAARGDFDATTSDLDFFIQFQDLGWQGSFKRYMGLKLDLERLLGRSVDLVELESVTNPYFLQVATKYRQLLYAA
jgi:predicted nucleotidyltransferase